MYGTTKINNKQSLPLLKYKVPLKEKKSFWSIFFKILPFFKKGMLTKELMCLNFYYMQSKNEHLKLLDYLKGDKPKQINTKLFFDFIETLEDNSQLLTQSFKPAVKLKTFYTRTSARIKFEDKNGNGADPKVKFRIEFYDDKTAKAILL